MRGLAVPLLLASIASAQMISDGVSRTLAKARAANISAIQYQLSLELHPDSDRMPGHEDLSFELKSPGEPLIIDYRDGSIGKVEVNGLATDAAQSNGHLVIPAKYLTAGRNRISVDFVSGVATAGRSITRYLDHDDGTQYIYSLFVPMDASQAFPCFDQPDLKARFDLNLTAPDSWTVVSNTRIEGSKAAKPGYRVTDFAETQPLPTYLFAFAAGPFKAISGEGLRLFVRQSKFERASQEAPEVLGIARAGVRHMAEYFQQPFPFGKYDLVLIPGFPFGGMEHAGATFLREESVLFRSVPTESDKLQRAALVLHETAHQWFGDFVTMRWFDDLWLKEGFAQYMAYETLATLHPPDEIWKRFYQSFKPPAYAIDSTQGTTPIHQSIENLKDAKSAYGAIVYSKTPGILRQLSFVIGESAFRDGVRLFLHEHPYGNAEWDDLIHAYERASGVALKSWADAWIKQRGMPQVDAEWSCKDGAIDRFTLRQHDVLGGNQLWPIHTQILLAYGAAKPVTVSATLDEPSATLQELAGKACPDWILANDRDYAYGRFLLDARSQEYISAHIDQVEEPFRRSLLWGSLWDGVRELRMAPADYVRLAIRALPSENDEALSQAVLGHIGGAFTRYLSVSQQQAVAPDLEAMLERRMNEAPDLSLRILYYRMYRSVATTPAALGHLKSILAGRSGVPGLEVKPQDRWAMITALVAHADPEAGALLKAETEKDQTGDGRRYAYTTGAAIPTADAKQRYFNDYLQKSAQPEDWIEQSLVTFNYWNQAALTLPYLERALSALPQIKRERKIFFLMAWLNAFISGQQSAEAASQVRLWLREHPPDPDLQRKVLEVLDELDRTVRVRARYSS